MKNLVLNLVLAFAAFAAVAGGKDDSGNDLTRQTLFGRIDGDMTTVGDLADFAQGTDYLKRNATNGVTETFKLSYNGEDLLSSIGRGQWLFGGTALYAQILMSDNDAPNVWNRNRVNATAIYDNVTNLTAKIENKANGSLYDEALKIDWKFVTYDGNLYYVATTNATEEVEE